MITPNPRCDCCGSLTQLPVGEDCSHCGYPVDPVKEERFLQASLHDLQRVRIYGGFHITVTQLIERYQRRLLDLSKFREMSAPVLPPAQSAQSVPTVKVTDRPETSTCEQPSSGALTNSGIQSLPVPAVPLAQIVSSQPATSVSATRADIPAVPSQSANRPVFSLKSFLADQTINIIASLGAFLILLGSLSFIITTSNLLLSFIVMAVVHCVFGISGAIFYRFRSFRVVAVIYTAIFALQVPLVGFAGYRLSAGHLIQLDLSMLIVITASYAAIAYGWLALYHKFELYAYLYVVSLAIVDLAICSSFYLRYWWWPGMLMLLALPALISETRTSQELPAFARGMAILSRPVRFLMFACVGVCGFGVLGAALYSLSIGEASQLKLVEVRFAIVYMLVLLLCWTALFIWRTGRTSWGVLLPYLFLACVVACSYAFSLDQTGYAVALTAVALLYHSCKRFFPQLLQLFPYLAQNLEWLALGLVTLVPWIASPSLPDQIVARTYQPALFNFQVTGETVATIAVLLVGLILSLSTIENHTGLRKAPAAIQNSWCWLLLLSGFILNWTYGLVILSLHVEPTWYFLGLTLILIALAVAVRRFVSVVWSDPLDVLALITVGFTLLLSLQLRTEYLVTELLGFAVLSYAIALYRCHRAALYLPLIFAVLALPLLVSLPVVLLMISVLLPLVLATIYRLILRYWQADDAQFSPFGMAFWIWPLLVVGLLYSLALFWYDASSPVSTMQSWIGIPFPLALEQAIFALVWYISAALARVRTWLLIMMGFAVLALFSASNMFWWLVGIAPLLAVLALGISCFVDTSWALPLYGLAMLDEVIVASTGYSQEFIATVVWTLLGFALLVYLVGVVERAPIVARILIWSAGLFACWSVYYSGVNGNYFFAPLVALTCAAVGVGIGYLRNIAHPFFSSVRRHQLFVYVLPWYVTAIFAAVMTGVYGVVFGVNKPFYGAIPDALMLYALVVYGIALLQRNARWLWLAAGFSLWAVFLLPQTYSCAWPLSALDFSFICGAPVYSLAVVALVGGLLGMLTDRFIKSGLEDERWLTLLWKKYTWSWPWYLTSLVAIGVAIGWDAVVGPVLPKAVWFGILGAFIVLWLVIMLVERTPEFLFVVAVLAACTIEQTSWPLWQVMGAYSLLCICLFALQLVWRILPPKVYVLSPELVHSFVTIGGLALVILDIVAQGGLSPGAGMLAHIGAGSLCLLAISLFCYGYAGHLEMFSLMPAVQRLCYYGAGLLLALVISWELLAFGQTDLSLLTIAPATYLIAISSFLSSDAVLPQREHWGGICAMSGAAVLLLPTLWSSFSQQNLFPALLLAGEALLLCLLGLGMRMRFFVLSGAALVIVSGIHILFLPSLGIPSFLALTISGGLLLVCATSLMLIRSRLASWS